MNSYDYIRIRGFDEELPSDTDPGTFEVFQGIGGDITIPSDITSAISEDSEVEQAVWDAQTLLINKQNVYLDKVKDTFNARYIELPKVSNLRDSLIAELAEEILGEIVEVFVDFPLVSALVEFGIGNIAEILLYLKAVLENHAAICDAMKAENEAIKTLEINRGNYNLRREILIMHDDMIDTLFTHVSDAEERIANKADKLPKGWKGWISQIDESIGDLDDWMDKATDGDLENNLPVPAMPKIPATTDVSTIALYYVLRFGIRAGAELINKWVDKARIDREELIEALKDLQYNDEIVDFGATRLHLRGKVIDY